MWYTNAGPMPGVRVSRSVIGRLTKAAALVAWFLGTAVLAETLPIPVTLMWESPLECPQYEEVWRQLAERLGRPPSMPDGMSFAVRAVVTKGEMNWRIAIDTLSSSGAGRRELSGPTCEEVTKAAVIALSLAIDPNLEGPPEVRDRSLWLGIAPRTSLGVLALPTAGIQVSALLDFPIAIEVFAASALDQPARLSGKISLAAPIGGGLNACLGFRRSRIEAFGCIGVEATLITGIVDAGDSRVGGLVSVGPALRLHVLLTSRLALYVGANAALAAVRPRFTLSSQLLFEPSFIVASGALGIDLRIW